MDLNGQTSLKFEVYRLEFMGVPPTRRGRAIRYNAPPTCHFGFRCYRSRIVLLIQQNSFLARGIQKIQKRQPEKSMADQNEDLSIFPGNNMQHH